MTNTDLFQRYMDFVMKLCKPLPPKEHLTHMILGTSCESGELSDAIRRHVIYEKPLDVENVKEELGDLLWYMTGIMHATGLTLEDVIYHNTGKLCKRYPNQTFTTTDANARADKTPSA